MVYEKRGGPETRFCIECLAFECVHMNLLPSARPPSLNWQEVRIIRMLAGGPSNYDLGNALQLQVATVKEYLFRASMRLRKAGYPDVGNRTALAAWGMKYMPERVSQKPAS